MADEDYSQGYGPFIIAADPVSGTDEVQTLTASGTVTAGTYRVRFQGFVSAAIAWNTTTAQLETALNNLPSIGQGGTGLVGVVVTGGPLSASTALTVTFSGRNVRKKALPLLVLHLNSLTGGGTVAIAEGTPGVDATLRGKALTGALVLDIGATPKLYQQTGADADNPTFSVQA